MGRVKQGEFYSIERWGTILEFVITKESGQTGWGKCCATTVERAERPAVDWGDRNEYKFRTNDHATIKIYGYGDGIKRYSIATKRP